MQSIKNQPTEKEIYIWNITGSMANALLSVVALMLVTRMLNKEDTDIFSIAWSISQLMVTIGTFQIRVYQATDIKANVSVQTILRIQVPDSCGNVDK